MPQLADQGKRVVDTHGEDLGMVSDVDGQTLYVEPDPSLTEKIMSTLHWREGDRDEMKVPGDRILRIDDEVVLDLERDSEFRSEP
ncbi:PRC-barrel domain containing protein [Natronomonas salina]|nr:PRC-barrel domain containing protein [Natronomonas salina]